MRSGNAGALTRTRNVANTIGKLRSDERAGFSKRFQVRTGRSLATLIGPFFFQRGLDAAFALVPTDSCPLPGRHSLNTKGKAKRLWQRK